MTQNNILHDWELLASYQDGMVLFSRIEVPGGWIYKHSSAAFGITMVFVPNPVTTNNNPQV